MEHDGNQGAVEARIAKEKEQILEALRTIPNIGFACRKAGIGRTTYYRWMKDDSVFRESVAEAMCEGTEHLNDMTEMQLWDLAKQKQFSAIRFWLVNRHPAYGGRETPRPLLTPSLSREQQEMIRRALDVAAVYHGVSALSYG